MQTLTTVESQANRIEQLYTRANNLKSEMDSFLNHYGEHEEEQKTVQDDLQGIDVDYLASQITAPQEQINTVQESTSFDIDDIDIDALLASIQPDDKSITQ